MTERTQAAKATESKAEAPSSQVRKVEHPLSINSPVEQILFLQRTAGNQAVQKLIKSRALQAKLRISQPNDIHEQEADRVADQIIRMPDPVLQPKRKCPLEEGLSCEEDAKGELKDRTLMKKEVQTNVRNSHIPSIVHEVIQSPGETLDINTRTFFEPRFGYDFSNVRVHTDTQAAESAHSINAKAYTVGRDIVFGIGQYNPRTDKGLIAHELAHVVQQGFGIKQIQRQSNGGSDECKDRGPADGEGHPLIYNCQEANSLGSPEQKRCKRPAVGHAQQLLNKFLHRYDNWKSGTGTDTLACAGGDSAQIQALRSTLPAQLKVDCWFGDLTYRATRMFQLCDGGLNDDGKIGEKTWPALEIAGTGGLPPAKIPPTKKRPPTPIPAPAFRCGPDVSSQVRAAVTKVISNWAGWSSSERDTQCDALDSSKLGTVAWDIEDLHNQAWILGYQPTCATAGASPPCHNSVEVDNNCYYAGSANYVVFGTMCKLCDGHLGWKWHTPYLGFIRGFPEWYMQYLITLYKGPLPLRPAAANYVPSLKWATAGFHGWPSGGAPPAGDRPGCATGCLTPYGGQPFVVHWWPHAPF